MKPAWRGFWEPVSPGRNAT